jgi:hypothetical protein
MTNKKAEKHDSCSVTCSAGCCIKTVFKAIWHVIVQIGVCIKWLFILIERSLKIIAIFVIAISTAILFIAASFYLFSATFSLKESPAFQQLRDKIANIYAIGMENKIQELEKEVTEKETLNK